MASPHLCSMCGTPVDANGLCGQGHDDLDRAGRAGLWLEVLPMDGDGDE